MAFVQLACRFLPNKDKTILQLCQTLGCTSKWWNIEISLILALCLAAATMGYFWTLLNLWGFSLGKHHNLVKHKFSISISSVLFCSFALRLRTLLAVTDEDSISWCSNIYSSQSYKDLSIITSVDQKLWYTFGTFWCLLRFCRGS